MDLQISYRHAGNKKFLIAGFVAYVGGNPFVKCNLEQFSGLK